MKIFNITTTDGAKHAVMAEKFETFGESEVLFRNKDGVLADFNYVENVSEDVGFIEGNVSSGCYYLYMNEGRIFSIP